MRTSSHKLPYVLAVAGLFSGLFTGCQVWAWYLSGVVFGVAVAICLAAFGIFDSRRGLLFTAVSAVAFWLAFYLATSLDPHLPFGLSQWPPGEQQFVSPAALSAAGVLGGFLVLGGALSLLRPEIGKPTIARAAASWSLSGGVLAFLGWLLAPSLGSAIWRLTDIAHISGMGFLTTEGPSSSGRDVFLQYSLNVVWQTGMGLVLGVQVGRHARTCPPHARKDPEKP